MSTFEHLFVWLVNRRHRTPRAQPVRGPLLGRTVEPGAAPQDVRIATAKRAEHMVVLGRTGSGKSSLLLSLALQDVAAGTGLVHIDLHADSTAFLLRAIAAEERRTRTDLSSRLVLIEPGDPAWAVGLNVLEAAGEGDRYRHVAEVTAVLKQRWQLDSLGARTEELVRNVLLALSEAGRTLVDVPPFLTDEVGRANVLRHVANPEVRAYFAQRFGAASPAMQQAWREPVLNKVTALTADPHLRAMLGQARSTISLRGLLDAGAWVLLSLDKARLGEQAATVGSLFFTALKNAIFARRRRTPVSVYADELQNLVAFDADIETMLAEARKFGAAVHTANQYLEQYPPGLRAALMAAGTHVLFQLSGPDADRMGTALGGGKALQRLLAELPPREFVVKSGHLPWQHAKVPPLPAFAGGSADLVQRSKRRWARPRAEVDAEIAARTAAHARRESLDGWE
jgi:energy-coupling factor transporter ATP-binding protein EcfA2